MGSCGSKSHGASSPKQQSPTGTSVVIERRLEPFEKKEKAAADVPPAAPEEPLTTPIKKKAASVTSTTPPPAVSPAHRRVRKLDLEQVKTMMSDDTSNLVLGAILGKGAYGNVIKATDTITGEQVAIKRINPSVLAREGASGETRLYREVAIMGGLSHHNLVNLHKLCYDKKTREMWIVLELVEGQDLMKVIKHKKRLLEPESRKYFQQIVVGVNYLHAQRISHRDLKPENIMISRNGTCKITDFGLSNVQNTDTLGAVPQNMNLKTCCGTPYYIAPEVVCRERQEQGIGYSGFSADVWSVGVILYVMVTGVFPYKAKNLPTLLDQVRAADYEIPTYLSEGISNIIKAIMNKELSLRYTLLQISQEPWFTEGGFDKSLMDVDDDTVLDIEDVVVEHFASTIMTWIKRQDTDTDSKTANTKPAATGLWKIKRDGTFEPPKVNNANDP